MSQRHEREVMLHVALKEETGPILREAFGNLGAMEISRTLSGSHLIFGLDGTYYSVSVAAIALQVMAAHENATCVRRPPTAASQPATATD